MSYTQGRSDMSAWFDPDPDDSDYTCPICGKECDELYISDGMCIGCDQCVKTEDPAEWNADHKGE